MKNNNSYLFFSQKHINFIEPNIQKGFSFYSLSDTGQIILEVNIETNLGGETVEIAHLTDIHINYCEEEDFKDSETAYTYQKRLWLNNADSLLSLERSLQVADCCDQTVITGDILDFLSVGARNLTVKHIFEHDSEVICTLGGHDLKKQIETGLPEQLSLEKRYNIVKSFWCNDVTYHSKIIKEKVIIVALDNSQGKYIKEQIPLLKRDIEKARKENKIILIFQHEPVYTANENDFEVKPMWARQKEKYNFLNVSCGHPNCDKDTKEMYNLICDNSDIIKGIFCGHLHEFFYTEVKTKNGYIPQFVCPANPYNNRVGIVGRIIVK